MNPFIPGRVRLCAIVVLSLVLHQPASAQDATGEIVGRVMTDEGRPLAGVVVRIETTSLQALTDRDGEFRMASVPAGTVALVTNPLGWAARRTEVDVPAGGRVHVEFRLAPDAFRLDDVVVTTSGEAQRRTETPATVNTVSGEEIERRLPSHPSELMNRMPGVWVNVTGGEGHMAAIRHPMTTNAVYLYLENGVPTRSTGFFNHNALYEIDVPHAARVEVVKGPSTALYGSDAIGGMVNVFTRAPGSAARLSASVEGGAFGFGRVLASATAGNVLGELNVTRTDGWRDGTAYNRQSATLRWDGQAGASAVRAMLTYSRIDQNTAGSSALPELEYNDNPRRNLTPISYRDVQALRASVAFVRVSGNTLVSVTPFARWNTMEMLPNWSLTYDPAISQTGHASAGAMLMVRHDVGPVRMVGGADVDYSPGVHREWLVVARRDQGTFIDYERGAAIYDYGVTFRSVSPYAQLEAQPLDRIRIVAGLRFDVLGYRYENDLSALETGSHRRPPDTTVQYEHISPKLGIVWNHSDAFRLFGNYGHGFRAPSEGQLFRQGRAASSVDLRPVVADNLELGAGGTFGSWMNWDVALYHMRKKDDLLSYTRPDGSTETVNAGRTLHRGIEVGAGLALPYDVWLDLAFARAQHSYEDWMPSETVDLGGNDMESAPSRMASAGVTWTPQHRDRTSIGADVVHVGPYWMDAANTNRYDGHTTVALRGEVPVTPRVSVFGRVTNLFDTRYAELAQFTTARGREMAPGMPRALYIGARFQ